MRGRAWVLQQAGWLEGGSWLEFRVGWPWGGGQGAGGWDGNVVRPPGRVRVRDADMLSLLL